MNAPDDDGLFITDVRWWSRDKHHFLARYIDAFTTSMKDKPWSGLHYVDLFAGAGIERIEGSGSLAWGSPLIAAQAQNPFTRLHLCEENSTKCEALRVRIARVRPTFDDEVLNGDANALIGAIVGSIPPRSLALAFLDPTGLHLAFESLRVLSEKRADLIIFFPDRLDILRNWKAYYWENPRSNLDSVYGPGSRWRERIEGLTGDRLLVRFREIYCEQIAKLGYRCFGWEPIPADGRPLYRLIFCSRAETGLGIWQRVSQTKPGGQRSFSFDD